MCFESIGTAACLSRLVASPGPTPECPCRGVRDSGFSLQGLGFRVQCLEFMIQGSGFGVQGLEFRLQALGFRVQGLEFMIQGSVSRV